MFGQKIFYSKGHNLWPNYKVTPVCVTSCIKMHNAIRTVVVIIKSINN